MTVPNSPVERNAIGAGAAPMTPCSIARLDHVAAVSLEGRDAAAFLHNQVSNDIENLEPTESTMAAYCNPKGRVITILRVLRTGETAFLLLMPRDLVEPVLKRLRMFVLRQKATFQSLDSAAVFGLPDASAAAGLTDALPARRGATSIGDDWLVHCARESDRFLYVSSDGTPPSGTTPDAGELEWFGVMAADATPEVFAATSEAFLPQALNLDRLDAINFRKGCFPGQEIVARLRYLGKLKQRMVRVAYSGVAPAPGETVFAGEAKIGQVVLAGSGADGGLGLVSVNFAHLDGQPLSLDDGRPLTVSLPDYDLPELAGEPSPTG